MGLSAVGYGLHEIAAKTGQLCLRTQLPAARRFSQARTGQVDPAAKPWDTILFDLKTKGIRSPLSVLGEILADFQGVEIEISFLRCFLLTRAVAWSPSFSVSIQSHPFAGRYQTIGHASTAFAYSQL
jgi:hypothetical protein